MQAIFFVVLNKKCLYLCGGVVEWCHKVVESGGDRMFIGQYRHNLDSKNRLIIPAKFRDSLGESFIVTKGLDGCLTVYTNEDWEVMIKKLTQIPSTKKEARLYLRNIASKATECQLDSQGRIQLPQFLIATADIKKSCVILGVADHVEIWPEETWDSYDEEASESFETVAESLTEFLQ
jgi:MraZ protein